MTARGFPSDQQASPEQVIQAYLDYLSGERRLSVHSVQAAAFDLSHLRAILVFPESSGVSVSDADATREVYLALKRQLGLLFAEGRSAATIARMASSWRQFYAWLVEQGIYQDNPAKHLKTPRRAKLLPKVLSPDAAQVLLKPLSSTENTSLVLAAVLAECLYGCGLRISEALSLDEPRHPLSLGWVDWHGRHVHVLGKGSKQRIVPLGTKAFEALQAWLTLRSNLMAASPGCKSEQTKPEQTKPEPSATKTDDCPLPLFVNQRGKRLGVRSAQRMVADLAREQGLDRHLHPHMLRHSYASHILQSSGDLRGVQELLGHTSLASTQIYTALDDQYLAKVYDAAHPRAKKHST